MGDRNRNSLPLRVEPLEDRLCLNSSQPQPPALLARPAKFQAARLAARPPINPRLGPLAVRGGSRNVPADVVEPLTHSLPPTTPVLSVAEVNRIIGQAVAAANALGVKITVAVTDREVVSPQNPADFGNDPFRLVSITPTGMVESRIGGVLGVFTMTNDAPIMDGPNVPVSPPAPAPPVPAAFHAIAKAAAGSFFSSDQEAFSTDTAAFIVQNHFPPNNKNAEGGPLYGVENSDEPFSDINPVPIPTQPLVTVTPGGFPLFVRVNGRKVEAGGVGVTGGTPAQNEAIALAAARGFEPPPRIRADILVFLGGIRLPFTKITKGASRRAVPPNQLPRFGTFDFPDLTRPPFIPPDVAAALTACGVPVVRLRPDVVRSLSPTCPTVHTFSPPRLPDAGALPLGLISQVVPPAQPNAFFRPGATTPSGDRLEVADVQRIIDQARDQAENTRAAIREARNPARVWIFVVDTQGNVLGGYRTPDATVFSFDVAVQKARTAAFFSTDDFAITSRGIGFLSQRYFPPGIAGPSVNPAGIGPLFGVQDLFNAAGLPFGNRQGTGPGNGITIFPGGDPLYKNGHLVGAVGISGDGVDQDDIIAFAAARGFEPAPAIRSDQVVVSPTQAGVLRHKVENILAAVPFDMPLSALGINTRYPRADQGTADQVKQAVLSTIRPTIVEDNKIQGKVRLPYSKFPRKPNLYTDREGPELIPPGGPEL